jgi:hypothetical protein
VETPRAGSEARGEDDDVNGERPRPVNGGERHARADQREAAVNRRVVRADAREQVQADRGEAVQRILADADDRDDQADARDSVAEARDKAASLHSFLHDGEYGPALQARRSAAVDRSDSKADRNSAAADRSDLAADHPTPPNAAGA